ncbi:Protein CBR-NLR-1 [Caenorhabditis briggsae]|uniref:Protein CBR-NLR-1 n=1 Tax=Caenorhabditis briggsae TaxID=6238 RepID=A8X0J8_CAEBR|nr:Protein CBR-NLR-1 [Caenorhabditis briggsae]CAP26158.2 Protein CBR-NLR-1 [Caenorhabditis briggsae]
MSFSVVSQRHLLHTYAIWIRMRRRGLCLQLLLFFIYAVSQCSAECSDVSFSSVASKLDGLKRVTRLSVSGHISAYHVKVSISDDDFQLVRVSNGNPLVLYSTLSNTPSWTHVDFLASEVRILPAFEQATEDVRGPLLILTVCDYDTPITAFDDSSYTVESHHAGLVSMYENDLCVVFRTYRSGVFFFSMADQGDVLIAQIIHGTIHVIFDFGSLTPSRISAGKALDDGRWHEVFLDRLRWLHQFDSVQLSIDGVLLNQTAPTGLYRKLDLHSVVHIGGRPADDFSQGIETTFTGCIARLQLNNADLLQLSPSEVHSQCQMPKPPSFTLHNASRAVLPFTFLPFSFEFRIVPINGRLVTLFDAENGTLVDVVVDEEKKLHLVSNITKFKQAANPAIDVANGAWHSFSMRIRGVRMEIDIDGYTVLWLEGHEVRRISQRLSNFILSASGCYRSATIDLTSVRVDGNVTRGECTFQEKCLPNPCENGGGCVQSALDDYVCNCRDGYKGKNCHTTDLPHSCEEWVFTKGNKQKAVQGRTVLIDIDGGGEMQPINVTCKTERDELGVDGVSTILEHDLIRPMIVTGDNKPGAVRYSLTYGISIEQMDRLVEGFEACSQFMRYTCRGGVRLMTQGDERSPSSWYSTRSDKHGLQWGEAPPYSRMCSCAINGSCLHNRMCNCDSGEDSTDEGVNPYSQLLPVTGLFLGGTTKSSSIEVEIGPLKCRNRATFDPVTFSDRNAKLSGTQTFNQRTFDVSLHVKFSHSQMSILSWHSTDDLHWFHLYVNDGKIVGEVVNGGESQQIVSDHRYDDGKFHAIYWEVDSTGMFLKVDGQRKSLKTSFVLPTVYMWIVGSRTEKGSTGFAGVIRNVYLCGVELTLGQYARKETERGIALGDDGYCRPDLCQNGGQCVDKYDGYVCDCSMTPFGGSDCSKEYGMMVPAGSSIQIPWQNPAHQSMCHRIAIQTASRNTTILRSKALFADSTFNMTVDDNGNLQMMAYDGFFFHFKRNSKHHNLSDDVMHDISFCASKHHFNVSVDGMQVITIEGNWTFFESFNVWHFLDENFEGCVSRVQTGSAFPLKSPKTARLNYSGKIRFGTCPIEAVSRQKMYDFSPQQEATSSTMKTSTEDIKIFSVSQAKQDLMSKAMVGGFFALLIFIVCMSALICYMRTQPEGVYKTNETGENCSPSRSEEPLVHNGNNNNSTPMYASNKEYFC